MTFEQFLERLRTLKVDRSGGVAKPYKPVLLCAVVVLVHKGEILSREVFLDRGLESVFYQLLRLLYPGSFPSAKVNYPFRHLETDGVWTLVARDGGEERLRVARAVGGAAWQILKHVRCAQLDPEVFAALASSVENRLRVLQLLIRAYNLPMDRTGYLYDLLNLADTSPSGVREPDAADWTEKAVEEHLETHWNRTEFARMGVELCSHATHGLGCRQVLTPVNTIDLLGFRTSAREWWVFELKKGRSSDAVVGQVQRYMGWIAKQAQPGQSVHGAIIVGRTDDKLVYSVGQNERLSLWKYDDALSVRRVTVG